MGRRYIYTEDWTITTYTELHKGFIRFPEEIRWDYCNSTEEYIYQGIEAGKLIEIKYDGTIVSDKILTPKQYGKTIGINIPDDISIAQFDECVADEYCKWNYPLEEYNYLKVNNKKVVIVVFKGPYIDSKKSYRFVEV